MISARHGQAEVWQPVCLPPSEVPERGLTPCQKQLDALGLVYRPWSQPTRSPQGHPELLCEVPDPVWLTGPIHGVSLVDAHNGHKGPLWVSCPMALALEKMAGVLERHDIVEVHHVGAYNCRTLRTAPRLSQHAHGAALDIVALVDKHGDKMSLSKHWEKGQLKPASRRGRVLLEVARAWHTEQIFNVVLTPEYNQAHEDHFHVDLSPNKHFLSTSKAEVLMGPMGD